MKGNDSKLNEITFDTESASFEEVKVLAAQVQEEIPDDSPFFPYKAKFNKELTFFQSIFNKNQLLLAKLSDQNAQIISAASKIQTILKTSNEDTEKLNSFKQRHAEVLSIIESLHKSETSSRSIIESLSKTLYTLQNQVEKDGLFSNGDEESAIQVANDVKMLREEISKGEEQIHDLSTQISKENAVTKQILDHIKTITENSDKMEAELANIKTNYDKTSKERNDLREKCLVVKDENKSIKETVVKNREKIVTQNDRIGKQMVVKSNLVKSQLDEMKKLREMKQTIMAKGKQHNELVNNNHMKKADALRVNSNIGESEIEIKNLQSQLENAKEMVELTTQSLHDTEEMRKEMLAQKFQARKDNQKLKNDMNMKQNQITRDQNESKRYQRNIQSIIHEKTVIKKHLSEEKTKQMEIQGENQNLRNQKFLEKKDAQDVNIKLRNFEIDIDNKTSEIQHLMARELLVSDEREGTLQKIEDDTKLLDSYEDKTRRQSELIEVNRNERNAFKRKWIKLVDEQKDLLQSLEEQCDIYSELSTNLRETELKAAKTSFLTQTARNEVINLTQERNDLQKMVIEATRASEGLKSQKQILTNVYDDFEHKKSLESKKITAIKTSIQVMNEQLHERTKLVNQLRYDIKTIQNRLEKGYTLFDTKKQEIERLENEYSKLVHTQLILEEKKRSVKTLQSDYRRYYNEYNLEMQKTVAITNEFGIPRNIHRWSVYQFTNPAYAQQLRYHCILTARLDEAHVKWLKLLDEKKEIEKKIEMKNQKVLPHGKKLTAAYPTNIENLTNAIADKDREIKEISEKIDDTREQIEIIKEKIDALRGKVTQRRGTTAVLRGKNYNVSKIIRAKTSQGTRPKTASTVGESTFFITQNAKDTALPEFGGGFVLKTELPQLPGEEHNEIFAHPAIITAANSSRQLNNQIEIKRPKTVRRRPQTATRN
ncbi:hypothetical protein TVAG_050380 [Trichomonas vaginalis G3]|uniref:Uncharacterized protein n=1 Tax=Trichomonas vaginalis (strain ATCC PRA-98 / G3) TaxID=412133 RepID=A2EJG5_TRIV3|nr:cilia- and flagella-associated protein 58-related family [Trichomonas vaginalis G3]EAY07222.1 hypothetical protein TVAG_050380 [Trichomonas vaginalis G3]KAI5533910.1 cilia- and flagella-associated protein 58-related family [Trichomonas vaginalis G3]|eukprot:XP_001319445.1 hypothetical protein [Trichomonas vaginalis G3]